MLVGVVTRCVWPDDDGVCLTGHSEDERRCGVARKKPTGRKRCRARTQAGHDCSRYAQVGEYCTQHAKRREIEDEDGLTPKERAFLTAYVTNGYNAVRAMEAVGSAGSYHAMSGEAQRYLKKPSMQEALQKHWDAEAMKAQEVFARTARMARSTLDPFIRQTDDGPVVDLGTESAQANLDRLRKVKTKKRIIPGRDGAPDEIEIETEIELHDPKDALKMASKHLGLDKGGAEVTVSNTGEVHLVPQAFIPSNGREIDSEDE